MVWHEVLQLLVLQGFLAVLVAGKSIPRVSKKEFQTRGPVEENDLNGKTAPFSLEETYDASFRAIGFNGTWITDTEILYIDGYTGDIRLFNVTSKTSRLFLDSSVLSPYDKPTLSLSYDNSHLLIGYDFMSVFRHSAFVKFVVYSIKQKSYTELAKGKYLALAKWSPTENAVVYVLDNDIYYEKISDRRNDPVRLTNTGVPGIVYNGVPDWVYEEEVLASAVALWFSPDGDYLAFATYNDSAVKDFTIPHYGKPGSMEDQYPKEVKIKYPKAGSSNPSVSLSMVNLSNPSAGLIKLEAPVDIIGEDYILYTVTWAMNFVAATWTNRVQNKSQVVYYSVSGLLSDDAKKMTIPKHMYQEEHSGWLRIYPAVFTNRYAIVLQLQDSGTNAGRFIHAMKFDSDESGKFLRKRDLTPGAAEVTSIVAVTEDKNVLYYLGTGVDKPTQRNLYSVPLDGSEAPSCLSCDVKTPEGNNCTYVFPFFSAENSYYALSCMGPDPTVVMILDTNHKVLYSWEENRSLRRRLADRKQPRIQNLNVRANGYNSNVRLYLPPDFDERKSYPLLINVYSGPNTVRITEANSHGFESYMTTNRSVIYGHIDGRGSAFKGSKMLFEIYRRMGTVEIEDQIAVTRSLQEKYSWIDRNRTAIWGWSYGGFATAMTLATDVDSVFKCGISVAPVTSWIYYDSIYTERFMGLPTPEDNLAGYNGTDVTRKVDGIRGKKFMLIHGTEDDNVHYQQSMALNKALVHEDIMFQLQSYTDEAHGLTGVSPHLYHTMDRFWSNCFGDSRAH
ncbi:venom dipeptidyl peptidase 4 [Hylaeus volcanicus]|uniref:venom dipeptidyl peptidase 4 n=1 Tax=Hylaeus volcanicus TaxID=313075 RepID=UPI0023B7F4D9|nr:venom dipeptidyl peptidase 4 [Hylaeus volcanicus]